jgi:sulfonate transport system substrate-binding protein
MVGSRSIASNMTCQASPLCWAVSVGKDAPFHDIEDLRGGKFGISRYGSGSHLMICVLANQRGWNQAEDVHFEVKGNFQSLRDSVNDRTTDAFIWETFMTKVWNFSLK